MPKIRNRPQGFTVIEVLIVLVVIAFMMLLVFVIVPRSQKESRNFQRKHAVDLTASALEEYKSNHGHIPYTLAAWNAFQAEYLQTVTENYSIAWRDENQSHDYMPPLDTIALELGHSCNTYGDGDVASDPIAGMHHDTAKVKYVIWTLLETNSSKNLYCIDNRGR